MITKKEYEKALRIVRQCYNQNGDLYEDEIPVEESLHLDKNIKFRELPGELLDERTYNRITYHLSQIEAISNDKRPTVGDLSKIDLGKFVIQQGVGHKTMSSLRKYLAVARVKLDK